jgi:RHH-type transcriptional regulator, proline utilization regulon repressor / proline dehydrogenase / delta 1-pyrroline-5-carboxylate dehydrogenase
MKNTSLDHAKKMLSDIRGQKLGLASRIERATHLTKLLLIAVDEEKSFLEKMRDQLMHRMLQDDAGKAFVCTLFDTAFRSKKSRCIVDQISFLFHEYARNRFLRAFGSFCLGVAKITPFFFIWLLHRALRKAMKQIILPGEKRPLDRALKKIAKEGFTCNVNRLGEAILGEKEAQNRIDEVMQDLAHPHIQTVSIKISSIYCHINVLAFDETLYALKERFRKLLRKANEHKKTITLDMEAYTDLHLTQTLFQEVLSEKEFIHTSCGIALQSYIPDSFCIQKELTYWAIKRNGAPIKIRLVKGANLGMEQVEASCKEWMQAPFTSKGHVDAHFKKMLHFGMQKEHQPFVLLSIGSHNLFDIAYALILNEEMKGALCFEMLSGMAPSVSRTLQALTQNVLLYCAVAKQKEFHVAMAYLMRRLDENTQKDNFLTNFFDMKADGDVWTRQQEAFMLSVLEKDNVKSVPRRSQNRYETQKVETLNAPDTDFSQKQNRKWAHDIVTAWQHAFHEIPLAIDGHEIFSTKKHQGVDPFSLKSVYTYCLATKNEADIALSSLDREAKIWAKSPIRERIACLQQVAATLEKNRSTLIGAMMQDVAKPLSEADAEVSEAIDFARYYAHALEEMPFGQEALENASVCLVATPWNFPLAIPTSAILSSIATGHSVLFKPAPESVLVAWMLCQTLWEAGISKKMLQFITCDDLGTGSYLVQDPRVDKVILTGATSTARAFLQMRPKLKLFAETGGKNAIIVTCMADRDLAVRDIVQSAFSYSGQKCSACSLVILDEELYYDTSFQEQLKDAATSLITKSQWNLDAQVVPLIRRPSEELLWALTTLDKNERWLVEPKKLDHENFFSCGIVYGVQSQSKRHTTEFFGPVIGVMCAKNLRHAIDLVNQTPYGLTSGLHSLDPREQTLWKRNIIAGNCYLNRTITGAIVGRQPFGGTKASSFGIGMKVGGPNYLMQFARPALLTSTEACLAACDFEHAFDALLDNNDKKLLHEAICSYTLWHRQYFSKTHVIRKLVGQQNTLFFTARDDLFFLIHDHDSMLSICMVLSGAFVCGCKLVCGVEMNMYTKLLPLQDLFNKTGTRMFRYKEARHQIEKTPQAHVRACSWPHDEVLQKIASTMSVCDVRSPSPHGRLELLHFLREVSLSNEYHRYGNLMGQSIHDK